MSGTDTFWDEFSVIEDPSDVSGSSHEMGGVFYSDTTYKEFAGDDSSTFNDATSTALEITESTSPSATAGHSSAAPPDDDDFFLNLVTDDVPFLSNKPDHGKKNVLQLTTVKDAEESFSAQDAASFEVKTRRLATAKSSFKWGKIGLPIVHMGKDDDEADNPITIDMYAYLQDSETRGNAIPVYDLKRRRESQFPGTPIRFVVADKNITTPIEVSIVSLSSSALVTDSKTDITKVNSLDHQVGPTGCISLLGDNTTALVAINHRSYRGHSLLWTMRLQIDRASYDVMLPLVPIRTRSTRRQNSYHKRLGLLPAGIARDKAIQAQDVSVPSMLRDVWKFNYKLNSSANGPSAESFDTITLNSVASPTEEYISLYSCEQFSIYGNPYILKRGCKLDLGLLIPEPPLKLSNGAVIAAYILSREIRRTSSADMYSGTLCEIVCHGNGHNLADINPVRKCRLTYCSSSLYKGRSEKIMGYVRKVSPNELMITFAKNVELHMNICFDDDNKSIPCVLRTMRSLRTREASAQRRRIIIQRQKRLALRNKDNNNDDEVEHEEEEQEDEEDDDDEDDDYNEVDPDESMSYLFRSTLTGRFISRREKRKSSESNSSDKDTGPAQPLTSPTLTLNQELNIDLDPVILPTSISGVILPLFTIRDFNADDVLEASTYQISLRDKTTQQEIYSGTAPVDRFSPPILKWDPTAKSPYPFCTLAFPSARDIHVFANTQRNLIFACTIKFSVLSKQARTNVTVRFDLIVATSSHL